jgi:hypothetical protein
MPDITQLPKFPGLFSDTDLQRKTELEKQKKQMSQVYQTTFEPEVWKQKPFVETTLRDYLSKTPVAGGIVSAITPPEWGFDYGFTPEQNLVFQNQVEADYSELLRKEQVSNEYALIKKHMELRAYMGSPITDLQDLQAQFKELSNFTIEEAKYVNDMMVRLAHASREDIASGAVTGDKPSITATDVNEYMTTNPQIDPRFILSTVAFSKNSEEISQALQYAYPPKISEEEAMRKKVEVAQGELDAKKAQMGIDQKTDNETAIRKVHEKIAADGQSFTLVDDDTGNLIPGMLRPDGYITVNGVPTGYYDKDTGRVIPISVKGKPIVTPQDEELDAWDFFGNLGKTFESTWTPTIKGIADAFFNIIPKSIMTDATIYPEGTKPEDKIPMEGFPGQRALYNSILPELEAGQKARNAVHKVWLEEHPEFQPKAGYEDAFNNPSVFLEPGFYGYALGNIASSLPALAASFGVLAATGGKGIAASAAIASAIGTPQEIASLYDDLKASGATEEEALKLSTDIGTVIGMVEFIPEFLRIKMFAAPFMRLFRKNITMGIVRQISAMGMLGVMAKSHFAEIGTEMLQEAIHNAAVKTVDDTRDIMANVPQSGIIAGISFLPITMVGGVSNYVATKRNLPKTTQAKMGAQSKVLQDKGIPKDTADGIVISKLVETEQGKAELEEANSKRILEYVPQEEVAQKQKELSTSIKQITADTIDNDRSIVALTKKVEKLEENDDPTLAAEKTRLEGLHTYKKVLNELYAKSDIALKDLNRMSKIKPEPIKALPSGVPIELPDTKVLPVDQILAQLAKDKLLKKSEIDAFIAWSEENEAYYEAMKDFEHYEAIDKSNGVVSKRKPPVPPKSVPSPVLSIIERFGTDVKDIEYSKEILAVKGLKEKIQDTILSLPIDVIVSVKKVDIKTDLGLDAQGKPREAQYNTKTQTISFRTVEVASSKYASTHELAHNIITERWLGGGNFTAFTIEVAEALKRMSYFSRIGKFTDGSDLGLVMYNGEVAGKNVNTNQLTKAENTDFQENLGRILEAYINDPNDLQKNAMRLYEIYSKYFPKKSNTENLSIDSIETIYGMPATPNPNAYTSQFPDRIPRQETIKSEIEGVNAMLNLNPGVSANMKTPPYMRRLFNTGKTAYDNLKSRANPQGNIPVPPIYFVNLDKEFSKLSKDTGIDKNRLLTNDWSGLTRDEQSRIAVASSPDGSLTLPTHFWLDMEYVMQFMEERTGLPFYSIYRRSQFAASSAEASKNRLMQRLSTDPRFKPILKDEVALKRVADFLHDPTVRPIDLTNEEENLADEIRNVLDYFKPYVRYMRIEKTKLTLEAFKEEFPDCTNVNELQMAIRFMEYGDLTQDYKPLWMFCNTVDWGVIQSGYDMQQVFDTTLKVNKRKIDTLRGQGRMMARDSVTFKHTDKNVIERTLTYMEQILIQWNLAPELNYIDSLWDVVANKFKDGNNIQNELALWSTTLQGVPPEGMSNTAVQIAFGVRRMAMSSFFSNPMLAARNAPQGLVMGLDRSESFRLMINPVRPDLSSLAGFYYDEAVSEVGGMRSDYIGKEGRGFKGTQTATKIADTISLFDKSEYYPRKLTFFAQLNKADRAMQALLDSSWITNPAQTQNLMIPGSNAVPSQVQVPFTKEQVAKYLNDSGANHLTDSERNYLLSHFLNQTDQPFDLGIEGLREISGSDMASLYVAQRCTDIVHIKYKPYEKSPMEMGTAGRLAYNLFTFPRSVAQRVYLDQKRIFDPVRERLAIAFNKDTDLETAGSGGMVRAAFKDIISWTAAASLFTFLYGKLTGREDDPYGIISILSGWEFGGVTFGVMSDIDKFRNSLIVIANPSTSAEKRKAEMAGLPTLFKRVGNLYPLYFQMIDVSDLVLGMTNVDKQAIRALLKGAFTDPKQYEKEERNLFDIFKKGILSIDKPDPTAVELIRRNVQDAIDLLFSSDNRDERGDIYTLRELGAEFSAIFKNPKLDDKPSSTMPLDGINTLFPKPSLPVFWRECKPWFDEYDKVPTTKAAIRQEWRRTHIEAEAALQFWGKINTGVFNPGSKEYIQIQNLKNQWRKMYGITDQMMPKATFEHIPPVR